MNRLVRWIFLFILLVSCSPAPVLSQLDPSQTHVPEFDHIVLVVFENKGYDAVIGNLLMPTYNQLAQEYTLLTNYYAVRHPSLPNYLSLIGGDTFGIDTDCTDCFIDAPSLPDLIEASGRTWKAYQEDMPEPCFLGNQGGYAQRHNPFVYFDRIRTDHARCEQNVVPLSALKTDIEINTLPNFLFITPNTCHDSHDCSLDVADAWLVDLLSTLTPALERTGKPYLVVLMFDEAETTHGLRRFLEPGGGHVAVILYSPLAKNGFQDSTRYTHYSILKTVSESWGLEYLGHAADQGNVLISAPWK